MNAETGLDAHCGVHVNSPLVSDLHYKLCIINCCLVLLKLCIINCCLVLLFSQSILHMHAVLAYSFLCHVNGLITFSLTARSKNCTAENVPQKRREQHLINFACTGFLPPDFIMLPLPLKQH